MVTCFAVTLHYILIKVLLQLLTWWDIENCNFRLVKSCWCQCFKLFFYSCCHIAELNWDLNLKIKLNDCRHCEWKLLMKNGYMWNLSSIKKQLFASVVLYNFLHVYKKIWRKVKETFNRREAKRRKHFRGNFWRNKNLAMHEIL